MQVPPDLAAARPRVTARPVGRTPLGIRALRLATEQASDRIDAVAPVAADVAVGLALGLALGGSEDGDVAVDDGMLRQWGSTLDQALAASFDVHGGEHPRIEAVEAVTVVNDASFAAFVLRTPAAARALVRGTPIAIAPTDRHLVLAPQEDPAALAALARQAERLLASGAPPVSATPLVATGDGWRPVDLPPRAQPAASDLRRRFAWLAYRVQRPVLQAHYDRSGQRCEVADAVVVARPGGGVHLNASLTEGVPTALPWVEAVRLVRGGATVAEVPMAALAAQPGLLAPLPGLDPPRWYPTRFPVEFVR